MTYSDSEKILCFLKDFTEQLIAQRMVKGIDFKKRLTCVILLGDVLEEERTFGPFFNQIQHIFDSEDLALDYFILTNSEFLEASKAHSYSTRADIIIEFSSKYVDRILESKTYELNRLNEALLIFVEVKNHPEF